MTETTGTRTGTETATTATTTRTNTVGSATQAILRIGAALLFMQHGVQKLFGLLGGVDGQGGTAELFSLFGLAGILEVFGALLILLGLFTRPVAILLAIEMVVAHFMVHQPQGGLPVENNGELPLLYALVWIFFAGNGPGAASIDGAMRKRRKT